MPPATSSSSSSSSPKPIFGVEIEIFVKVKKAVQRDVEAYRSSLPAHWRQWDFDLSNRSSSLTRVGAQRVLKESQLSVAPEADLWWGVEIISPPMSVARRWQSEIREVFDAVGEQFELWTHPVTSCHVHVSPGPKSNDKYTNNQLVRIAKGAFYWEKALKEILPHDRRDNPYAKPNHRAFGTSLYRDIDRDSWRPLFGAIDHEMDRFDNHPMGQKKCFAIKIAGGHLSDPNDKYRKERYLSQNFLPLTRIGTVELRRQGGVASAQSTIHRVLLAVTLHVSARRYDFTGNAGRRTYPTSKELIDELSDRIASLPRTCHGTRFVHYLKQCVAKYGGGPLTERDINSYERKLHEGSGSSVAPTRRATTASSSGRGRGGGSGRGGGTSGRGGGTSGRGGGGTSGRGGGGTSRGGGSGGGSGRGGGSGGGSRGGGGRSGGGSRGGTTMVRNRDGRLVEVVDVTPYGR
ncbi:uncharacterized protein B0H64DRAFT_448907 [Chaetomium fimeti]|uniref:Uncharacterized protein n=1 Tax=Chaetomium fimeti TaxID=1854472 RepID=A0AAE0HQL2_9PEZI|nr:hypothetical protein B0H64DRAFT_448907 [Chaetomium fimeti]